MVNSGAQAIVIGVLALQGSFREHLACLAKLKNVVGKEIRNEAQLSTIDGLIIPGGESTTMALIAEREGILSALKSVTKELPTWGTCAGLILLSNEVEGAKKGGQAVIGGLDCVVSRNYFGAQINSFEASVDASELIQQYGSNHTFRAVFIRAPAIVSTGADVDVLARIQPPKMEQSVGQEAPRASTDDKAVIVGARQGHIMGTAFHPELTNDLRWHQLFVDMVREHAQQARVPKKCDTSNGGVKAVEERDMLRNAILPADLPVYNGAITS